MAFPIKIIKQRISHTELKELAKNGYGNMLKIAVDIEKKTAAAGGEWHSEAQALLLENGSNGLNVWGANIFLDRPDNKMIEYVALINIKPRLNRSMEIQDKAVKDKIKEIITDLIA